MRMKSYKVTNNLESVELSGIHPSLLCSVWLALDVYDKVCLIGMSCPDIDRVRALKR